MSSKPKQAPAKAKQEAGPRGPMFTPQVVGVVVVVIVLASILVFVKGFYQKKVEDIAGLDAQISKQLTANETYKRKAGKLPEATDIKNIMDRKLEEVQPHFLKNQDDVRDFFFRDLYDLLVQSNIDPYGITLDLDYEYSLSWYTDSPFETMPDWIKPEDAAKLFPWKYNAKPEGQDTSKEPEKQEVPGAPDKFIAPLTIHIKDMSATYEGLKRFIENLQRRYRRTITVHCFKNDEGENAGLLRVFTKWEMDITIYLMNPSQTASGDEPEGMPGAETC